MTMRKMNLEGNRAFDREISLWKTVQHFPRYMQCSVVILRNREGIRCAESSGKGEGEEFREIPEGTVSYASEPVDCY